MSRSRARRQQIPTETSWRMVEGEHDSFDTSLVPDEMLLDDDIISSGGPSQLSNLSNLSQLSQLSSLSNGDWNIGGSQDNSSIQDFIIKADDERVIMRSPFQPSVPGAPRRSPRTNKKNTYYNDDADQSPDPEFYMPKVDVDSPRRNSSAGSARTIRPGDAQNVRQRRGANTRQTAPQHLFADPPPPPSVGQRMATSAPLALYEILAWAFGVVGMAFRYAQKPLALALAIYLIFGTLILASNWLTHSFYTAISPLCNIPGVSYVELPFCPKMPDPPASGGDGSSKEYVDFDSLIDIQDRLPNVLEMSAQSVSLPLEMKRSEASIRDLRTMVRYSELRGKDELVLEFDGFIETARAASSKLQRFNAHVGSAVDSVISINRWTSRYLNGLALAEGERKGLVTDLVVWAFRPFQPVAFDENRLLASYVEHTARVSDKIAALIEEATVVLDSLERLDGHLDLIHDWATRTHQDVAGSKSEVLLSLWTMVGANKGRLRGLDAQLRLLSRVGAQRRDAVRHLVELKVELVRIQGELEELRERVAAPGLGDAVPLSVHVETINAGVANLEQARTRIRGVENDRIREMLLRGKEEQMLIDSS